MPTIVQRLFFVQRLFLCCFCSKLKKNSMVLVCQKSFIGGMMLYCWGTMKSEEFLLSQTLPSCSNHPSSPEQPRAGNPGRSVLLSTDTQPPSAFRLLLSSPNNSSYSIIINVPMSFSALFLFPQCIVPFNLFCSPTIVFLLNLTFLYPDTLFPPHPAT